MACGQFQHRNAARRIVIGAVVDPVLRACRRLLHARRRAARADVINMGTQQDHVVRARRIPAGEPADGVPGVCLLDRLDLPFEADCRTRRQLARGGEGLLAERHAGGPRRRGGGADRSRRHTGKRPRLPTEAPAPIGRRQHDRRGREVGRQLARHLRNDDDAAFGRRGAGGKRGDDAAQRRRRHRRHRELLPVRVTGAAHRQHGRGPEFGTLDLDRLHVAALVAHRLEPPAAKLGGNIRHRDPLVARAAPAAVQSIACEKFHVCAHGCLGHGVAG